MLRKMWFLMAFISCLGGFAFAGVAERLQVSGVQGGLIVHLGCDDGKETIALKQNDRFLVQGLETDPEKARQARANIRAAGLYGKVTVYQYDGKRLPYVDNMVNLLIADGPGGAGDVAQAEILRVLAPLGVAYVGGEKIIKPWPDNMDEWNHFLRGADNNAVAQDDTISAPRSIQWVSGPRWGRSHEEMASMSAAVSAKGRVFFIFDDAPLASIRFVGQWRLVARDAFNGIPLWTKSIPKWSDHLRHFRAGPVHLPRRLAAVGDRVFVTLGLEAPVTALDAATGDTILVYKDTERAEEILVDNGVLYLVVGTSEVNREGKGLHRRGEAEPTEYRYIMALDVQTGETLWKSSCPEGEFLLPLTMTVADGSVFCQSTANVIRLDAKTGKPVWRIERKTPQRRMSFSAPTLVAAPGILLCADRLATKDNTSEGKVEWGVDGWNGDGFPRQGKAEIKAYAIADGKELWKAPCGEDYNAAVDVFVVGDTVWVGDDYKGYDLKTGELKKALNWKGDMVAMAHHRCYRNKASLNYIFTGRSGIEMVDLEKGWQGNNSWIRGTCQYGILPSNGLLYAPPDACGCYPKVKLAGFFAAGPRRGETGHMPFPKNPVLEKGPAYGKVEAKTAANKNDWPMYRADVARSGATGATIPETLNKKWSAPIGGKLTQPVIADGRAIVASIDTHTIHALRARDGREEWNYTAGGRIDSSPALYKGMVLFGSADGWIYALRASDGALAWRFRAAPIESQVGSFDQLESAWPVHGAVLVQNDTLYAQAGRSTYLDGGIVLYRLNPETGEEISKTVVYDIDPDTDKQTGKEYKTTGFDMEGSTSDVLSGDGESVFMKHLHFTREGEFTPERKPHLFGVTGFLGEEWFVRSYWLIGTDVGGGWGGWANSAGMVPFGRILSFNEDRVYGYGRTKIASAAAGHTLDTYHLFGAKKLMISTLPLKGKKPAGTKASTEKNAASETPPETGIWSREKSLVARGMALTPDKLIVAGPPEIGEKTEDILAYTNEPEALSAFEGAKGVSLQVVRVSDGETLSKTPLGALPVFDGLSVAQGSVFLALKDGTVERWGE